MIEDASRRVEGDPAELGAALRTAIVRVYRRFRVQRPRGELGEVAFTVLTRLHKDGPQTLTALSAEHGVSLATMSEIVNRLTAADYAMRTRDETDRRRVLLTLTPGGDALAAAARAQRHAWFDTSLASLSSEDRTVLARAAILLERIADERALPDPSEAAPSRPPGLGVTGAEVRRGAAPRHIDG